MTGGVLFDDEQRYESPVRSSQANLLEENDCLSGGRIAQSCDWSELARKMPQSRCEVPPSENIPVSTPSIAQLWFPINGSVQPSLPFELYD